MREQLKRRKRYFGLLLQRCESMVSWSHSFEQDTMMEEYVVEVSSPHGGQEIGMRYEGSTIGTTKGMPHSDVSSIRFYFLKVLEPPNIVTPMGT